MRPDCRAVPRGEARRLGTVHSPHIVYRHLCRKTWNLKHERAWLLLLSRDYYLASEGQIGRGTHNEVEIDLDWALACVRLPETPYAILAHNHPNGLAWPSVDDENLTRAMGRAAGRQGVQLLDHVVIGRDQYFSFQEGELWQANRTRS
jgi:DNA repair protein RadC